MRLQELEQHENWFDILENNYCSKRNMPRRIIDDEIQDKVDESILRRYEE